MAVKQAKTGKMNIGGAVGKTGGVKEAPGRPNVGSGPVGKGEGVRKAKGRPNAGSGPIATARLKDMKMSLNK